MHFCQHVLDIVKPEHTYIDGSGKVWCVFVRASLHMRREEKLTRCHWMLYCTYDMLNIFRALLCTSSGARDYMCVITAYGAQCLVAGCPGSGAGQEAVRPGRGKLHDCRRFSFITQTNAPHQILTDRQDTIPTSCGNIESSSVSTLCPY